MENVMTCLNGEQYAKLMVTAENLQANNRIPKATPYAVAKFALLELISREYKEEKETI